MRFPEKAEKLFKENEELAMDRYARLLNQKASLDPVQDGAEEK
jgi:hypothetical protein